MFPIILSIILLHTMQHTNMHMYCYYFFTLCTELHVARMQIKFCRSYRTTSKSSAALVYAVPALYMRWSLHCGLTLDLVIYSYSLPYLFTAWGTALLKKLTVPQLVKKYPAFYGTWRFITAFTTARHLSLSWAAICVKGRKSFPTYRSTNCISIV